MAIDIESRIQHHRIVAARLEEDVQEDLAERARACNAFSLAGIACMGLGRALEHVGLVYHSTQAERLAARLPQLAGPSEVDRQE